MLHAHFDFITLSKVSIKWVKKELKAHAHEFRQTTSVCPYDMNIHGITVVLMHDFSYTRMYTSRKKASPKVKRDLHQKDLSASVLQSYEACRRRCCV